MSKMKLSDQAVGAIMMALQKSLLEETDIVPVLKNFELASTETGVIVKNPPIVKAKSPGVSSRETVAK